MPVELFVFSFPANIDALLSAEVQESLPACV
jgi:hypothetical protein